METKFNWFSDAWLRVKNHCRTTMAKEFTENEPTEKFKKSMLIAEHSPIRLLEFDWTWKMPYWVHAEWARHKFEKFISSQRDDRVQNDIPRGQKPQDTEVTYDGYANMQNLIDAWRKRLCHQASDEAREYAESFKTELSQTHKLESDVLVPNCIYRGGCPEFGYCKYHNTGVWPAFLKWCRENNKPIATLQQRYDAYNEWFYSDYKGDKK